MWSPVTRREASGAPPDGLRPHVALIAETISDRGRGLERMGCDCVVRREEWAGLRQHRGFAAISVTHDQDEALSLSDRIVLMRAGGIGRDSHPDTVTANRGLRIQCQTGHLRFAPTKEGRCALGVAGSPDMIA